jgi:hypothetical protein
MPRMLALMARPLQWLHAWLQAGGLAGLALTLLYFFQEKIVSDKERV